MSSKRAIRRRSRKGKVRHETEQFARIGLFKTVQAGAKGLLGVYRCRFCGGWHVGHVPGKQGFGLKRS